MKMQSDKLRKLNPLVGKWQSEGEVLASASGAAIPIKGTDSYEWVCDGKFLLHRVDVMMAAEKVQVIEMIGYHESSDTYPMRSFDNQGNFTTMQSTVDAEGVWKLAGHAIRSTLRISPDGKEMTALWERFDDGSLWQPWMRMKFRKHTSS